MRFVQIATVDPLTETFMFL